MSPTTPTLLSLYSRLTRAHCRIRQLEAREAELLAQIENGTLTRLVPRAASSFGASVGECRRAFGAYADSDEVRGHH